MNHAISNFTQERVKNSLRPERLYTRNNYEAVEGTANNAIYHLPQDYGRLYSQEHNGYNNINQRPEIVNELSANQEQQTFIQNNEAHYHPVLQYPINQSNVYRQQSDSNRNSSAIQQLPFNQFFCQQQQNCSQNSTESRCLPVVLQSDNHSPCQNSIRHCCNHQHLPPRQHQNCKWNEPNITTRVSQQNCSQNSTESQSVPVVLQSDNHSPCQKSIQHCCNHQHLPPRQHQNCKWNEPNITTRVSQQNCSQNSTESQSVPVVLQSDNHSPCQNSIRHCCNHQYLPPRQHQNCKWNEPNITTRVSQQYQQCIKICCQPQNYNSNEIPQSAAQSCNCVHQSVEIPEVAQLQHNTANVFGQNQQYGHYPQQNICCQSQNYNSNQISQGGVHLQTSSYQNTTMTGLLQSNQAQALNPTGYYNVPKEAEAITCDNNQNNSGKNKPPGLTASLNGQNIPKQQKTSNDYLMQLLFKRQLLINDMEESQSPLKREDYVPWYTLDIRTNDSDE